MAPFNFLNVGAQGFEPCLNDPKSLVLAVDTTPRQQVLIYANIHHIFSQWIQAIICAILSKFTYILHSMKS